MVNLVLKPYVFSDNCYTKKGNYMIFVIIKKHTQMEYAFLIFLCFIIRFSVFYACITLVWHTKSVLGTAVSLMALKPPAISVKFR